MDNRGIDLDPGWINRQLRELRQAIEALRSERRAAATTVSSGDFVVSGGGSVVVRDGGGIRVLDTVGADALTFANGDLSVGGGGSVVVRDGGGIQALHPNGNRALQLGPITTGGGNPAQGMLFRDPSNALILGAYSDDVNGERVVLLGGDAATPLKLLQSIAVDHILQSTAGDIQLKVPAGRRVFIGHETTAAGANCFINTDGSIWRSTSSLRYKQDVRPAEVDTAAVLALQPREYRSRAEVAELGDDAPTRAGFIAEEAAELGLEQWVVRDDEGAPEAFNYSQFCVAQQAVLQQQAQQIATLTARLERLEQVTSS